MTSPDHRPIVVAVDGTPGSAGALRYGARAALDRGTSLRLVHVAPSYPALTSALPTPLGDLRSVGLDILAEAAASVLRDAPGLEVRTTMSLGSRGAEIDRAAADARLVVLGRESRTGLDRLLNGTTTAGVAARCTVPAVIVPSYWTPGRDHGRIVVGIKSQTHVDELLSHAFAIAAARGAGLVLTTAWELPDPYFDRIELRTHAVDWITDGTAVLESVTTAWREAYPAVPVELHVVHGRPASVLLGAARGVDLVVLARPRRAVPPHDRLGGVAHGVLRGAEVPVEVVPIGYGAEPPAHPSVTGRETAAR